jgi:hypothetical protein
MVAKFGADFAAAFELLAMFNHAIVTALVDGLGPDDETLAEMLPNVNEIHGRLRELEPVMPDGYAIRIIAYLAAFCQLCKAAYAAFVRDGAFDIDALAEMAGRGIPQPDADPAPAPAEERASRRRRRRSSTSAAAVPAPQAAPAQAPDDLIDFGDPPQEAPPPDAPQQHAHKHRRSRRKSTSAAEPARPPPPEPAPPPGSVSRPADLSGFEFADDDSGVSNAEFAAFLDQISTRKK